MRRWVAAAGIVIAVAAVWIWMMPLAPLAQPLGFNHGKHTELACAVCHQGAETAARASLPPMSLCQKCHATSPGGVASATWDAMSRPDGPRWIQVTTVPDHVAFSHRRHVKAGRLECASCHQDIGRRMTPPGRAPIALDMDTCMSCHQQEGVNEDCAGCHR